MRQVLFYRVLLDNFVSMSAVVYTPTVGWACLNYHKCGPQRACMAFCMQPLLHHRLERRAQRGACPDLASKIVELHGP